MNGRQIFLTLFAHLRNQGFVLGVGELRDGFRALDGGWVGESNEDLRQLARLLWCRSPAQQAELEIIWTRYIAPLLEERAEPAHLPASLPASLSDVPPKPTRELPPLPRLGQELGPVGLGALPVASPAGPDLQEEMPELVAYWPVSRRDMVYAWRYLRRLVADGPADVLDIPATVNRVAQQGFYLGPIFRRGVRNNARLLLLLDQGGSMVPLHPLTRDLASTAQQESDLQELAVLYFHNVPVDSLYRDPYRLDQVALAEALAWCDSETSVLIVSDAGAARGWLRWQRAQATTQFLLQLRRHTSLIAWLNPMPAARWPGTSAQVIAYMVPMFQMDPDGFSNAVDVLRGQVVGRGLGSGWS